MADSLEMIDVWIRVMGLEMEGSGCVWGIFWVELIEFVNELDVGS